MSYFIDNDLERTPWSCSLNLEKFFQNNKGGFYKKNCEYVVIWYDKELYKQGSNTLAKVSLVNLTEPTYEKWNESKKQNEIRQSFITVRVPINYLHKMPFGSIWYKGKSKERFVLEEFTVSFSENKNLTYEHLRNSETPSFEYERYIHASEIQWFKNDSNHLLVVKNDSISYIIHPLQFFMAHYGYSGELKRILSTYNWEKVKEKLNLNTNVPNIDKAIVLPRALSEKDAVFLHHLKYDKYTRSTVKVVSSNIVLSKESYRYYTVCCWHNQDIHLSFRGIRLGNSVLCCQITGISQPQGEPINVALAPIKRKNKNEQTQDNGEPQYKTIIHQREHELEKLDISLNPVNNIVTNDVIEYLILLGEKRAINRIQTKEDSLNGGNMKFLGYEQPTDFSTGEKQGKAGLTGIANCLYDISDYRNIDGVDRLETVWKHATRLRTEIEAKIHWYTPKRGLNESDNFILISLQDIGDCLDRQYPPAVLVMMISVPQRGKWRNFIVLSFPEKLGSETGFSSIVYEPESNLDNEALTQKLIKILVEIVQLGAVESEYVDSYDGRMTTFIHRRGQNNNWVKNGLNKLL